MRYFVVIFCLLSFNFSGLVYGQSETEMIKESFLQTIHREFSSLQRLTEDEKAYPEKTIKYWEFDNTWHAFYDEYYDFTYDIKKTDSIVTPYLGIVTFRGKSFEKKGDSKAECLNDKWKTSHDSDPSLKYAYQDGVWVLKEVPPVYKKH
jgi:hypothetical protein